MFVTGGAGFLGTHLVPLAVRAGWSVHAPESGALDVTDADAVDAAIDEFAPDAVVHLAYRRAERDTIVEGSAIVAHASRRRGARLVHLSTDVVFGGRDEAYREGDPLDPVHDYGRFKAEAERRVARACPGAVMVRTSLLYGTEREGVCQDDVRRALRDPGRMAFFVDEVRSFTHAGDLAAACLVLAGRPEVAGPLHVAGPEPVTRHAFAVGFAEAIGADPRRLRAGTIAAAGLSRPARVVLDTRRAEALGVACRPLSAVFRGRP